MQLFAKMSDMNDGNIALLVGAATVVGGLIGTYCGAWLAHLSAKDQWKRDMKVRAVATLVEETSLLVDRLMSTPAPSDLERAKWMHALQAGRTTIHLLFDDPISRSAEDLISRVKAIEKDPTQSNLDAALVSLDSLVVLVKRDVR